MRVLIVSQHFWPEVFQINELARTLVAKGVDIEVLTAKPNYPAGEIYQGYTAWGCATEFFHGIPVHRVPLLARRRGAIWLAINYLSFILSGLVCGSWLLRRKRYDAIFVFATSPVLQAIPAIWLGWLKRCPTVVWVQDLWPESLSATGYIKNKTALGLVRKLVKWIYARVDLLLVQSQAFVEPVTALAGATTVLYHPNSVDESFSVPTTEQVPDINGLNAPFSVLFAGNIGTAQGVDVIIEAATLLLEHKEIQFVVVGDGSRRAWMLEEIRARGLSNVHLPGRFPVSTMPALMRQASAVLVTLADEDIFSLTVPSKLQAYLAAGRPILACLNGEGARVINAAEAGITVPAQNALELSRAVIKMALLPHSDREKLGENGRSYHAQHYSHDMLVSRLIILLASCAATSVPVDKMTDLS